MCFSIYTDVYIWDIFDLYVLRYVHINIFSDAYYIPRGKIASSRDSSNTNSQTHNQFVKVSCIGPWTFMAFNQANQKKKSKIKQQNLENAYKIYTYKKRSAKMEYEHEEDKAS